MEISETSKKAAFAALALLAIGALCFALFFSEKPDLPAADASQFYHSLSNSSTAGFLFDVRGATSDAQKSAIYQCGVDIISKGRLAQKTLLSIACDDSGCIYITSAANGSRKMPFSDAKLELSGIPYIYVLPGDKAPAFFERHMEIYIPENISGNVSCDISATES